MENLLKLIPPMQYAVTNKLQLKEINAELNKIPDSHQIEDSFLNNKVYAHYFFGGCDWYILSIDKEDDIFHCFAILNNDFQNSELGTTYIADVLSLKLCNLDYYWTVKTLKECLIERDKDYYIPYVNSHFEYLKNKS